MTEDPTIKTAIINAAMLEFELHGYADTQIQDIADGAGVSRRAMQRHFLDKKSIFLAVLGELAIATKAMPFPRFTPGFPVRGQLEGLVQALIDFFGDERNCRLCRIVIAEIAREAELGKEKRGQENLARKRVGAWLAEAMAEGSLRSGPPEVAAQRLMAQVQSMTLWPTLLHHDNTPPKATCVQDTVDFFLAYYGVPGR